MSYTLNYTGAEIDDILARAVQGGAIDQAIAAKQDALTFDDAPTSGSDNPVKSGGIYDAIQAGGAAALGAYPTDSVSGDVVSFPDGADGIPVKSFVGSILPAQSGSGDPAPDNVRPISGWTEANITRAGKNLIDWNNRAWVENKYINANGEVADNTALKYFTDYLRVKPSTTYSVTGTASVSAAYNITAVFFSQDGTFLGRELMRTVGAGAYSETFTTPSDCAFVTFNAPRTPTYSNFQIEEGTATAYEAYDGSTILLDFGQTVYAGTLTALGGGLWQVQPTHKAVDMGTLTWAYNSAATFPFTASASDAKPLASTSSVPTAICSMFKPVSAVAAANEDNCFGGWITSTGYAGKVAVKATAYTTVAAFTSAVTGQTLLYPLATLPDPIIVSAEDLATLLGENTVWTDVGSVTGMTYRADTALYIQKLIGGGGTLQTLSMASPSPSLSLGRVGVLAEPEVAEPEQAEEETEQTEEPDQTEEA